MTARPAAPPPSDLSELRRLPRTSFRGLVAESEGWYSTGRKEMRIPPSLTTPTGTVLFKATSFASEADTEFVAAAVNHVLALLSDTEASRR